MGCSGRDKDIVMTRGNKGIRARGRIVVEHAAVINALQCGGVLAPNPCLALALAGQALLAPLEVLCSTLACDIPSNHSSCNTTPEINTSFIENHHEANMQVFV